MLFLPREYFTSLVTAIPELGEYFASLSEQRLTQTEKALEEAQYLESVDIVFDDERIMI